MGAGVQPPGLHVIATCTDAALLLGDTEAIDDNNPSNDANAASVEQLMTSAQRMLTAWRQQLQHGSHAPMPAARPSNAAAAAALRQRLVSAAGSAGHATGQVHPALLATVPPSLWHPSLCNASIMFLGTGSAEPSKHRGSSGILLRCVPATLHGVV